MPLARATTEVREVWEWESHREVGARSISILSQQQMMPAWLPVSSTWAPAYREESRVYGTHWVWLSEEISLLWCVEHSLRGSQTCAGHDSQRLAWRWKSARCGDHP